MHFFMIFALSKIVRGIGRFGFYIGICIFSTLPVSCIKPTPPEEVARDLSGGYTVVGRFQTSGYAQDVVVADSCAYMAQGQGGIAIVKVRDPEHPVLLSELLYEIPGYSERVAYAKDSTGKTEILYSGDGTPGIATVDVTNKINPTVVRPNNLYKPTIGFFVCKNILLSMTSADGIWLSDIRDPRNVMPVVQVQVPGYAKSICMSMDSTYALVAIGEGGVVQYNFSLFQKGKYVPDPHGIDSGKICYTFSGRLDLPGSAEFVVNIPGTKHACIACGTIGLQILDYTDTSNIIVAGSFPTGGYASTVRVDDDRAYVAAGKEGLQIIDISDIASPKRIGKVELTDVRGVDVGNGYLYVADLYEGLIVIKIPSRIIE
jgi:hypothetical protein